MKVSDYIIRFLSERGVTDVFGYPGVGCGHLMESFRSSAISVHTVFHEQAESFAACAYAQARRGIAVCFVTAGPGATNLITGIANAYCDSIPVLFIVGDKDYSSLRQQRRVRQLTSQEVDIVSLCMPITKASSMITNPRTIAYCLEKAVFEACSGRPGPVLLDIPSDIQRASIDDTFLPHFSKPDPTDCQSEARLVSSALSVSKKPLILIGNGVRQNGLEPLALSLARKLNCPLVTTLVCRDCFVGEEECLGFIGMDGNSCANNAVKQCDCLLTLGARLNFKQVTHDRSSFAPNAKIIRVDTDRNELDVKLRDELCIHADLTVFLPMLLDTMCGMVKNDPWLEECIASKQSDRLSGSKNPLGDTLIAAISQRVPDGFSICADVGSNRRWLMTHFIFKPRQRFFQSAGLASMGYSLPAAIGAYYATRKPSISFNGDGGVMMNVQELQTISALRLPIIVVVLNNHILGDIAEFQQTHFGEWLITTPQTGYCPMDFRALASAFNLSYAKIDSVEEARDFDWPEAPCLVEVVVPDPRGCAQ